MKRLFIISLLLGSVVCTTDAQLLEDTDRKLKSAKVERRGFLFFRNKKKNKTSAGAPQGKRGSSPRYTRSASPFKGTRASSPRYTKTGKRTRSSSVATRNSAGNPFRGNRYSTSPRYSSGGSPFRGSRYSIAPRYSKGGSPFKGNRYSISPRYSKGNPFRGGRYKASPRYSKGNPFRGNRYSASPRYSKGNPFRGSSYRVSPRYSSGMPFSGKHFRVSPRYSPSNPFRGHSFKVSPRYSVGIPFSGRVKVSPRFSTHSKQFEISKYWKKTTRYYTESATWRGDWKVKRKAYGDQHPSSNHRFAKRFSNPGVRKMLRQWNVFWTRLNGNKQNPKGVKKPVQKPKFDKKERVIWNN